MRTVGEIGFGFSRNNTMVNRGTKHPDLPPKVDTYSMERDYQTNCPQTTLNPAPNHGNSRVAT